MGEPNRLRDQVAPSGAGTGTGWLIPEPAAERAPGAPRWSGRRAVVVTAVADALILVGASVISNLAPATAWSALAVILLAPAVVGFIVTTRAGGRRAIRSVFVGIGMSAMIVGAVGAVALTWPPGPALPYFVVGYVVLVFIFQAIPAAVGAVVGSTWVGARAERRHRAVARGEAGLVRPTGPLARTSDDARPLDAVSAARLVEDGAATRVVRIYRTQHPGFVLGADAERLAALGYALTSVVRTPPKSAIVWVPLTILTLVAEVALLFSHAAAFVGWSHHATEARRGRCVATFDLASPDHRPVAVDQIA